MSKKKTNIITVDKIGNPTNPRIIQSVGLTGGGFDVIIFFFYWFLDDYFVLIEIKVKLNDDIGSKEIEKLLSDFKLPNNTKTTVFIKSFINDQGGFENFKNKTLKKVKKRAPLAPNLRDSE